MALLLPFDLDISLFKSLFSLSWARRAARREDISLTPASKTCCIRVLPIAMLSSSGSDEAAAAPAVLDGVIPLANNFDCNLEWMSFLLSVRVWGGWGGVGVGGGNGDGGRGRSLLLLFLLFLLFLLLLLLLLMLLLLPSP
eukprot:CAMPEP_0118665448 /NCGR_PEP_ID=MMETSP0785-20121206/18628_1 /TAXON_ID=91992 /ORGANISM="Bolidomonas pacifica, Strain CCMP 1866" /LENGTH=139 /DNA_ID=CAMNT_0006559575 /DNA_START=133 /DNA_END=548 /DNA_ORIENTATION=+